MHEPALRWGDAGTTARQLHASGSAPFLSSGQSLETRNSQCQTPHHCCHGPIPGGAATGAPTEITTPFQSAWVLHATAAVHDLLQHPCSLLPHAAVANKVSQTLYSACELACWPSKSASLPQSGKLQRHVPRCSSTHTPGSVQGLPRACRALGSGPASQLCRPQAGRSAPATSVRQPAPQPGLLPEELPGHCQLVVLPQPAASSALSTWPYLAVESLQRKLTRHCPTPVYTHRKHRA